VFLGIMPAPSNGQNDVLAEPAHPLDVAPGG
jgi:hypothetical protein